MRVYVCVRTVRLQILRVREEDKGMFHLLSMFTRCVIRTAKVNQGGFNSWQQRGINNPHTSARAHIM